mgnify:CR=1 FL=1
MNIGELIVNETDDGEMFFKLPDDLLNRLEWKEGDELKFVERDGGFLIKKLKYESVQLEFDEDELFKYMMKSHEMNITFNEFIELAIKSVFSEIDDNTE